MWIFRLRAILPISNSSNHVHVSINVNLRIQIFGKSSMLFQTLFSSAEVIVARSDFIEHFVESSLN
jgi:hypothetical protein